MRTPIKHLVACLCLFALAAWAQTNVVTPPVPAPTGGGIGLLVTLIPLAVPLLVAVAKVLASKLPSWSLPILATVLGAALNQVLVLTNQPHTNLIYGALLGAAGTGCREIFDQVKQVIAKSPGPAA